MPTIIHFEIPADDIDRAKRFYTGLFGWEITEVPELHYWLVTTSGERPIGGGMMMRQNPGQMITDYIDVPSVDEYASKVEKLGGKVAVPKKAVPGVGYFAVCLDTENNTFGIFQKDKNAQ